MSERTAGKSRWGPSAGETKTKTLWKSYHALRRGMKGRCIDPVQSVRLTSGGNGYSPSSKARPNQDFDFVYRNCDRSRWAVWRLFFWQAGRLRRISWLDGAN